MPYLARAGVLEPLPRSVLAAIVIAAIVRLMKLGDFLPVWRQSRLQGGVAAFTLVATLVLSPRIDLAVLLGIGLAIFVHLGRELSLTVEVEDVRALARPVLQHRLLTSFHAEAEGVSSKTIIDRLLEHARVAYFHHGGDNLVFISSADWMPRNLDKRVEVLVPDFRGRGEVALDILATEPPDVFNHNLETVPRLYPSVRPEADIERSLAVLARVREFALEHGEDAIPTKSGLMLGLGETLEEVEAVMQDLRDHGCSMLTLGQYLQPSRNHLPVERFVPPKEFDLLRERGEAMGFSNVASGPMVRSSYHADQQALGKSIA